MKRIALTLFTASIVLFACNSSDKKEGSKESTSDTTGTKPADDVWVPVDSATAMNKMMEAGTPGPMHQLLTSWSGTWNGETTSWDYEGATPAKSISTAVNTMMVGGKYQSSKHSGNMMGMPFEGFSIMGYDNVTKQFVSTWIDNWGTGIMNFTGSWDAASKTLTMAGSYPDMLRPGKECKMREVFKVIDDNTQHMEMYGPDPKTGTEFKVMEMHLTRKK